MRKAVIIGTHSVDMVSNALTPVLFKRVFHKDLLLETQKKDLDLTLFQELGYVMMMQASGLSAKDLTNAISYDGYMEWLEQFEALDIMSAVNEIFELYSAQNMPTSKSKKKASKLIESITLPSTSSDASNSD